MSQQEGRQGPEVPQSLVQVMLRHQLELRGQRGQHLRHLPLLQEAQDQLELQVPRQQNQPPHQSKKFIILEFRTFQLKF